MDDTLHDHPKVDAVLELDEHGGLAAMGLWALVLSSVSGQLTDGVISRRVVRRLAPEHGEALAAVLVSNGLWDVEGDGWVMHDYLDCNESRAKVLSRREARVAAGRRGGRASGETRRTAPVEAAGEANSEAFASPAVEANAEALADAKFEPRPDPTRPFGEGVDAGAINDEHTALVVAVLRTAPRLTFDPLLSGVSNVLAAYPNADHVKAAHIAVANVADPNYRTVDAAKALRYAIGDLERQQRPRAGSRAAAVPTAKPWDGAIRRELDAKRDAA